MIPPYVGILTEIYVMTVQLHRALRASTAMGMGYLPCWTATIVTQTYVETQIAMAAMIAAMVLSIQTTMESILMVTACVMTTPLKLAITAPSTA